MIKETGFVIGAIAVAVATVACTAYIGMKKKVAELESQVKTSSTVNTAQAQSGEIKNEQTVAITANNAAAGKLTRDVAGLRKSVEELKSSSKDSIQACNRSLAATGEVFGECTERYSEVAAKAERLKTDLIATDKHADVLEGLVTDLTGLEPMK